MKKTILLIEDDHRLRRILQLVLQGAGHEVLTAADGREGIAILQAQQPDVVLTDLKMEPVDGPAVLAFGKQHAPCTPIIMLTAFGTLQTAVLAMKDGAFDYLTKPVDNDDLLSIIAEALSSRQSPCGDAKELIGTSTAIEKVQRNIQLFAAGDSSVLISGESGTGKELAARAIHEASPHPDGPFVRVNCAAIPAELIESELFGHTQGAFTGASNNREGAFKKADGGTLFLDEIGDLPLDHFLRLFCRKLDREQLLFTPESMALLYQYPWPGNVRELKNVIERAILMCDGEPQITPAHLPSSLRTGPHAAKAQEVQTSTDLYSQEQNLITTVLQDCDWNQSKAARALGITRNTLRYRIKKYAICKSQV